VALTTRQRRSWRSRRHTRTRRPLVLGALVHVLFNAIEDAIHKFPGLFGTLLLGDFDRFINGDLWRDIRHLHQLIDGHAQNIRSTRPMRSRDQCRLAVCIKTSIDKHDVATQQDVMGGGGNMAESELGGYNFSILS